MLACSWQRAALDLLAIQFFAKAIFKTPEVFVLQEVIRLFRAGPVCLWDSALCGEEGERGPGQGQGGHLLPPAQLRGWWPQLRLVGAVPSLLGPWVPSGPSVRGAPALGGRVLQWVRGWGLGAAPCGERALCCGGAGHGLQPAEGSEQKW